MGRWSLPLLLATACVVNPVTGKKQRSAFRKPEIERAVGEAVGRVLTEGLGIDADVTLYLRSIGRPLAKHSHRPDLKWYFTVLDSPVPNALALPGGRVYVTRGLLAYLRSEAELAAVLAHEIAHVCALHMDEGIVRARRADRLTAFARILGASSRAAALANRNAQMRLLQNSRDAEREADLLALQYLQGAGYDTTALPRVMGLLGELEALPDARILPEHRAGSTGDEGDEEAGDDADSIPPWAHTHPSPQERRTRLETLTAGHTGGRVGAEEYIRKLDGVLYGTNPRDGFFLGRRFIHPDGGLRVDIPSGWSAVAEEGTLVGFGPKDESFFVLMPVGDRNVWAARQEVENLEDFPIGDWWSLRTADDSEVAATGFAIDYRGGGDRHGLIAFMGREDAGVHMIIAASSDADWAASSGAKVTKMAASYRRLHDPRALDVAPMRLKILETDRPMTPRALFEAHAPPIPVEELALLNGVDVDAEIPAGLVKMVQGFNPDNIRAALEESRARTPAESEPTPEPAPGMIASPDPDAPDGEADGEAKKGALDKDIIRQIVRAHIGEVRACYEAGLGRDATLRGRVKIQFTIGPSGSVPLARVQESDLPDAEVATCIADAVKTWRFPKPQGGGNVVIVYPFVLEPATPDRPATPDGDE